MVVREVHSWWVEGAGTEKGRLLAVEGMWVEVEGGGWYDFQKKKKAKERKRMGGGGGRRRQICLLPPGTHRGVGALIKGEEESVLREMGELLSIENRERIVDLN
jgi:hypothetical protein